MMREHERGGAEEVTTACPFGMPPRTAAAQGLAVHARHTSSTAAPSQEGTPAGQRPAAAHPPPTAVMHEAWLIRWPAARCTGLPPSYLTAAQQAGWLAHRRAKLSGLAQNLSQSI